MLEQIVEQSCFAFSAYKYYTVIAYSFSKFMQHLKINVYVSFIFITTTFIIKVLKTKVIIIMSANH